MFFENAVGITWYRVESISQYIFLKNCVVNILGIHFCSNFLWLGWISTHKQQWFDLKILSIFWFYWNDQRQNNSLWFILRRLEFLDKIFICGDYHNWSRLRDSNIEVFQESLSEAIWTNNLFIRTLMFTLPIN